MSELQNISLKPDIEGELTKFIETNTGVTSFPDLSSSQRKQAWSSLFDLVQTNSSAVIQEKALISCRLLSRDKADINECIANDNIDLLIGKLSSSEIPAVRFEAKKVLSNLIHQSGTVRAYCTLNGFLAKALKIVENHKGNAFFYY